MINARLSLLILTPALICVLAAYAGFHAGGRSERRVNQTTGAIESESISASSSSVCRSNPDSIRAHLFGTPVPPTLKSIIPPKQAAPQSVGVVSSLTPDPLSGYWITGIGELNGERYVLFEDRKSREGSWLKVGDEIHGAKIAEIDDSGVVLEGANGNQRLALNDKYDLTPLDKDAAYLGGRITKHEGLEQDATASKLAVIMRANLDDNITLARLAHGGEDYEKLNDDAFRGKVPLKEYHDRVNAAAPISTYNDLTVSYKVLSVPVELESFAVTKEK